MSLSIRRNGRASLTGDVLQANASGGTGVVGLTRNVTITNTTHTFSFYAKAKEFSWVAIDISGFAGATVTGTCYYDLANGVVGGFNAISGTITSVGNGWYRCTGIVTPIVSDLSGNFAFYVAEGNNDIVVDKSGTSGVFIWGAQLEAGAFATSYIPTVASQVTRAADAASMTGINFSSWYSQGEGTLYVESLAQNTAASNPKNLRLNDGTTSNEIWIGGGSPGTSARSQIFFGGTTYFDSSLTNQMTAGVFGKYAISFETNNAVLCANGTLGTVDTAVPISSAINQLTIIPPNARAGYYKKISYFPRRLSNAELQEMTS